MTSYHRRAHEFIYFLISYHSAEVASLQKLLTKVTSYKHVGCRREEWQFSGAGQVLMFDVRAAC